jgi:hypothetical protein
LSYRHDKPAGAAMQNQREEVSMEDLERLAAMMAQAIPELECPECCEPTWVDVYVERSAQLYLEELEWGRFAAVLVQYSQQHRVGGDR